MYLANYLGRSGYEARALQLFRQVSKLVPMQSEPYLIGLKLAQKLDDQPGIEWATVGILGQAWPDDKLDIWQMAHRTAMARLEQLKLDHRDEDAKRYEDEIQKAVERDVVAQISWSGDADVDISIEEPSGTICSITQPRTTSGGTLLGDSFPSLQNKSSKSMLESYVCPKGFDGKYRMLVRRVWGKPVAGKVTFDLYLHHGGTKGVEHIQKHIPLGDEPAMITFDLKDGRRVESLAQHQVETAAAQQLAARRQMLNQQLSSMADGGAAGELALSRAQMAAVNGLPFARNAVGFQPVITVLPSGTNLFATGVISADRRFVRFSGLPLFSGVTEVNTFSTSTGASGTSNGATGGVGGGVGGGLGGTAGSGGGGFGT